MKLLTSLLSLSLISNLVYANEIDPTRALKMKKASGESSAKQTTQKVSMLDLEFAMGIKAAKKGEFVSQVFFHKNSKTVYALIDARTLQATLLTISTPTDWTKDSKYSVRPSQFYKESYIIDYDPKSDTITGISLHDTNKDGKLDKQYISSYDTKAIQPKYLKGLYFPYNSPQFSASVIEKCGNEIMMNMPSTIIFNATNGAWKAGDKNTGKFKSWDMEVSNNCKNIILAGHDANSKPVLRFYTNPFNTKQAPKEMPIFRDSKDFEVISVLATDDKEKFFAVANSGLDFEVYTNSGKKLWSKTLKPYEGPKNDAILDMKFSPSSKILVATQKSGAITFFDLTSGKQIYHYRFFNPVMSAAFSPDGKAVAFSGGINGHIIEIMTDKKLKKIF